MANEANVNNNERGIKDSWSLLAFAHRYGMPRPNTSKNSVTGKEFNNLAFVDKNDKITFVAFSSKLGELSVADIKARKNELQVVQLNDDPVTGKAGGYLLCKAGNLNMGEVINLDED